MSAAQMQRRACSQCGYDTIQVATHCLVCGYINEPIKPVLGRRGQETDCATMLILDFEDGRHHAFGNWA